MYGYPMTVISPIGEALVNVVHRSATLIHDGHSFICPFSLVIVLTISDCR